MCIPQADIECILRNEKQVFWVHIPRTVFSATIQSHPNLKWATVKHGFPVPGGV